MSAPIAIQPPRARAAAVTHHLLMPLAIGLLLLGLLFSHEVVAAVQTWIASTAYNHCFLVIPIALYLLWDRRLDWAGVAVRPTPAALLLGLPLALIWLISERLGIMEGRQLAALSFAELLFLTVLGRRLWWAMAGPLLYLYFLVPFGEFLTPKLQDVTTFFISHGLQFLAVPAYIDGYVIEIPQGTFFVAEACAGLRFLIASLAFGCLYALMMYRSPVRRGLFVLVSIIVPIVANGIRGTGIVYLGYILGSAQAAAADHIVYGWVFFSAVILLLIALGLPFRQDGARANPSGGLIQVPAVPATKRGILSVSLGVVALAAIAPILTAALAIASTTPLSTPPRIELAADCLIQPNAPDGTADTVVRRQRVACGGMSMDLRWEAFSPRSTAGPVMAERRRLVAGALSEAFSEAWLDTGQAKPSGWRIIKSDDPFYLIGVAIWVDGKPARPGLSMRVRMALNSLTGSHYRPMVMTVTPMVDWSTHDPAVLKAAETSLSSFLLTHPGLDASVGKLSALP